MSYPYLNLPFLACQATRLGLAMRSTSVQLSSSLVMWSTAVIAHCQSSSTRWVFFDHKATKRPDVSRKVRVEESWKVVIKLLIFGSGCRLISIKSRAVQTCPNPRISTSTRIQAPAESARQSLTSHIRSILITWSTKSPKELQVVGLKDSPLQFRLLIACLQTRIRYEYPQVKVLAGLSVSPLSV